MSFKKDEVISAIEQRFDVKVGKWHFKTFSGNSFARHSCRICIWITRGGRIAFRNQTGGPQKKNEKVPVWFIKNKPRYYTTISGLLTRINNHFMRKKEEYNYKLAE